MLRSSRRCSRMAREQLLGGPHATGRIILAKDLRYNALPFGAAAGEEGEIVGRARRLCGGRSRPNNPLQMQDLGVSAVLTEIPIAVPFVPTEFFRAPTVCTDHALRNLTPKRRTE